VLGDVEGNGREQEHAARGVFAADHPAQNADALAVHCTWSGLVQLYEIKT
jgi:hypothetical protein